MNPSVLLLTAALAASPDAANARLALGAGTDFPISVGAHLRAELPARLQLSSSAGLLPGPYLQVLNASLVGMEAYGQTEADLIEAALTNALVWRTHVGWRPFASAGFYFSGGYTLIALGGSLTGSQAVGAATGRSVPQSQWIQVDATSTLHQAGLELGWRWRFGRFLSLETALGGFYTLGASTTLSAQTNPLLELAVRPLLADGEEELDEIYRSYVHAGYLSVRGYFWAL